MCASLQPSLHDHKLCPALCIVLDFAPAFGRISCLSCMIVWVFGLVKNGSSLRFDIHSRHCYDFRILSKRGNCRHPIFDRPQDLDVTIGTLGDYPCLCSSWVPGGLGCAPCLRISRLDHVVSGFAPNTCVLPERGRECLVRHPHTSPAMAWGHRLVILFHRQCILPVGTLCCRLVVYFAKMAISNGRSLFIFFL